MIQSVKPMPCNALAIGIRSFIESLFSATHNANFTTCSRPNTGLSGPDLKTVSGTIHMNALSHVLYLTLLKLPMPPPALPAAAQTPTASPRSLTLQRQSAYSRPGMPSDIYIVLLSLPDNVNPWKTPLVLLT